VTPRKEQLICLVLLIWFTSGVKSVTPSQFRLLGAVWYLTRVTRPSLQGRTSTLMSARVRFMVEWVSDWVSERVSQSTEQTSMATRKSIIIIIIITLLWNQIRYRRATDSRPARWPSQYWWNWLPTTGLPCDHTASLDCSSLGLVFELHGKTGLSVVMCGFPVQDHQPTARAVLVLYTIVLCRRPEFNGRVESAGINDSDGEWVCITDIVRTTIDEWHGMTVLQNW